MAKFWWEKKKEQTKEIWSIRYEYFMVHHVETCQRRLIVCAILFQGLLARGMGNFQKKKIVMYVYVLSSSDFFKDSLYMHKDRNCMQSAALTCNFSDMKTRRI